MDENRTTRKKQIGIYVGKCFRVFKNEKGWTNLISTIIIITLICSVTGKEMFESYSPTRSGAFALASACIWIGIFNSIRTICKERGIIKREHRTGLHISSYVLAHMIFEAALSLAESVIVILGVFIANFSRMPEEAVFLPVLLELGITFFLIIYSSDILGILISSIVRSENSAMTVMPFILIIQLIMSGMIFELSGVSSFLSKFTISRWGLAAICNSSGINGLANSLFATYMEEYEATARNLLTHWGLLVLFIVVYGTLSIIALSFVDKDKR